MATDYLAGFKKRCEDWYNYAEIRSSFGCSDTEPRGVLCWLVDQALLDGKEVRAPDTVRGWQIFDMPGAYMVARKLGRLAQEILDYIGSIPLSRAGEVREWWRAW